MDIIPCGTKARPNGQDLKCTVTAISIRFCRITYELSYFFGGDYKTIWLDECEFETDYDSKVPIGFKS